MRQPKCNPNPDRDREVRGRISGQGMTEYIIVVALIGIAAVAAVSFFGAVVKGQFVKLGGELTGTPDASGMTAAGTAQTTAVGKGGASGLADYGLTEGGGGAGN